MKRFKVRQVGLAFMMLILSVFLITGCGSNGETGHWLEARTLTSIQVRPLTYSVPVSGNKQFTATAVYSDGTSIDVTASSAWSSSTPGNASVDPSGWATGLRANTSSTIKATFDSMSGTATLNVNDATSTKFEVVPSGVDPLVSIPVTGTQQYAAIETFSDGTIQDRTTPAAAAGITHWSTSGTSNAKASVGATGLALGIAVTPAGVPVVINATFTPVGGSAHAATPANLIVNNAISKKFEVIPSGVAPSPLVSIPVSGTQQYAAIETFSDGTTQDRTTPAAAAGTTSWFTSGTSNAKASVGAATGLALGIAVTPAGVPVVINATFTPVGGSAHNAIPANLIVNNAITVSFVVTPKEASVVVDDVQKYSAIETFSDGETFDRVLTPEPGKIVIWKAVNRLPVSSPPLVATFLQTTGVATGLSHGTSTITAEYGIYTGTDTGAFGLADRTAVLTVTDAPVPPPDLAINLRSAKSFGIAARYGMTSTGVNVVNGDVALDFTATCTDDAVDCLVHTYANSTGLTVSNGFIWWVGDPPPGDNGATASAVLFDLNLAWKEGMAKPNSPAPFGNVGYLGGALGAPAAGGGKTIPPGVYQEGSTLILSAGDLAILDGTATDVWIFKVGSDLIDYGILANKSEIRLTGGALARNVWFVVQRDASIGIGTTWNGNILAGRTIVMTNNSTVNGRMLAGANPALSAGAVTLSGGAAPGTTITVPAD